jgi:hypothetical protein
LDVGRADRLCRRCANRVWPCEPDPELGRRIERSGRNGSDGEDRQKSSSPVAFTTRRQLGYSLPAESLRAAHLNFATASQRQRRPMTGIDFVGYLAASWRADDALHGYHRAAARACDRKQCPVHRLRHRRAALSRAFAACRQDRAAAGCKCAESTSGRKRRARAPRRRIARIKAGAPA